MNRFFNIIRKELYHVFRDRRTLLVLFGIPVMQILIFGYVITNDFKDIGVAVMDQSDDPDSKALTAKIFASGFFKFSGAIHSEEEIHKAFRKGSIRAVFVIEPDFSERMMQGELARVKIITDASDPNLANTIVNYLSGIVRNYAIGTGVNPSRLLVLHAEPRMVFNEKLIGAYMFVPGTLALILMLISALLTSISLTREKESGTMEVLLVSPLRPIQIILGKVTPYVLLSFINGIVILIIGALVFDLPIRGSIPLLFFELLLYITLALSLGIFISNISSSQQNAMFISLFALMLPAVLLSGFIYPVENMPLILQWLSALVPPRWFIVILKDIMMKGNGLAYVWDETLILLGMTLLFLLASIVKFKERLTA